MDLSALLFLSSASKSSHSHPIGAQNSSCDPVLKRVCGWLFAQSVSEFVGSSMKIFSVWWQCCPIGLSTKSWKIGALRSREISEMSTCCPTGSKQVPQVNFSPQRGSQ